MDKEQIKSELIARGKRISLSIKGAIQKSNEKFGAIKDLANITKTADEFTKKFLMN